MKMESIAMTITRFICFLAVALTIVACETDPFSPMVEGRFVVQAYLYAGEPATEIRITHTLPVGSTDSVAPPINNAEVVLIKEGGRYLLVPTPGESGYYHYPGEDLVVTVGDIFDLEVTVQGVTATARTIVPPLPDGVNLSATRVQVDGHWAREPVLVHWSNPGRNWYFVTHRNIESQPEQIFEGTVIIRPGLIISEPTNADSTLISQYTMRHYGRYEVNVHRVNEEYVQLYMSLEQDTRDLNEPVTNINDGIGIFTAFSRRETFFELVK
jgi:hypothetical protein